MTTAATDIEPKYMQRKRAEDAARAEAQRRLEDRVRRLVLHHPGLTLRELAERLASPGMPVLVDPIRSALVSLEDDGSVVRVGTGSQAVYRPPGAAVEEEVAPVEQAAAPAAEAPAKPAKEQSKVHTGATDHIERWLRSHPGSTLGEIAAALTAEGRPLEPDAIGSLMRNARKRGRFVSTSAKERSPATGRFDVLWSVAKAKKEVTRVSGKKPKSDASAAPDLHNEPAQAPNAVTDSGDQPTAPISEVLIWEPIGSVGEHRTWTAGPCTPEPEPPPAKLVTRPLYSEAEYVSVSTQLARAIEDCDNLLERQMAVEQALGIDTEEDVPLDQVLNAIEDLKNRATPSPFGISDQEVAELQAECRQAQTAYQRTVNDLAKAEEALIKAHQRADQLEAKVRSLDASLVFAEEDADGAAAGVVWEKVSNRLLDIIENMVRR